MIRVRLRPFLEGHRLEATLCGPQGTARAAPGQSNAPRWSATMAGEAHPVPFRTRKLSPRAPMVLRSESVGEQDVADQRGAFAAGGPPACEPGALRAFGDICFL